jgi:hypothetical protein
VGLEWKSVVWAIRKGSLERGRFLIRPEIILTLRNWRLGLNLGYPADDNILIFADSMFRM